MTFKSLFTYTGMQDDTYVFSLKPYCAKLFDTALHINYFIPNIENIALYVQVVEKPGTRNKFLFIKLQLDGTHVIMLKEDNIDREKSYRAVVLELLMLWLVQAVNLSKYYSFEQIIQLLNTSTIAMPQYFDMFAFRQLITQEFQDVNKFYVCSLGYLESVISPYTVENVNAFRQSISDTFAWLCQRDASTVSDADLWTCFMGNCKTKGIISSVRLSNSDKLAIIQFLRNKLKTLSSESSYKAKTNLLSSALNNMHFKLWTDFTVLLARKIVYPRIKTYSLQC